MVSTTSENVIDSLRQAVEHGSDMSNHVATCPSALGEVLTIFVALRHLLLPHICRAKSSPGGIEGLDRPLSKKLEASIRRRL